MTANVVPLENSALRLARYLKEFVGLRRTTVYDVAKYDSVLWFKDMPQEADCRSAAWTDDYDSDPMAVESRPDRTSRHGRIGRIGRIAVAHSGSYRSDNPVCTRTPFSALLTILSCNYPGQRSAEQC